MKIPFTKGVAIQPASPQECDRILKVEQASSPAPWSHEALLQELMSSNVCNFVAQHEGQGLCGFILSVAVADEICIHHLAVLPAFQRQGIARRLLETALEEARHRGAQNAYLEVRSKNIPAIGLYGKLGFHVQTIRKKYYSNDDDDALIMHKSVV